MASASEFTHAPAITAAGRRAPTSSLRFVVDSFELRASTSVVFFTSSVLKTHFTPPFLIGDEGIATDKVLLGLDETVETGTRMHYIQ